GILWGVLGDKRGRLSVLFGSITLYSIANIANGLVHTVGAYAVWRVVAGIGLAGELGAGVTLVSELMGKDNRAVGTTLVAALGVSHGPNIARSLFFCYGGCSLGGLASGLLGQYMKSRRRALAVFLGLVTLFMVLYFVAGGSSVTAMYAICAFGGFASGYWAV